MSPIHSLTFLCGIMGLLGGCAQTKPVEHAEAKKESAPAYFKVDPQRQASERGNSLTGKKPARKTIDMSETRHAWRLTMERRWTNPWW